VSQDAEQREYDETTGLAVPEREPVAEPPDLLDQFGLQVPSDAPIMPAPRTLELGGSVNFLLEVSYINRAEEFYHRMFEMDVMFRAWRRNRHWEASTDEIDWPSRMIYGDYPELVCLKRDNWTIVLAAVGRGYNFDTPKAADAAVSVSPASLRRLRARALMKGYTVLEDTADSFSFRDPFRVVWRLVADESLAPSS
jgi:hypothetical protein